MDPVAKRPRRSLLTGASGKSQNGVNQQDNDNDLEDPDDCDDDYGGSKNDSHAGASSAKRKVGHLILYLIIYLHVIRECLAVKLVAELSESGCLLVI